MNLRRRLLTLALPLTGLVLLICYGLSHAILLENFDRDDEYRLVHQADMLALQIDSFVGRSLNVLRGTALSNDAVAFVLGHDRERFLARNLDPDTVANEDFNFILLFDNQGRLLAERWVPPNDRLPASLTQVELIRPRLIELARAQGLLDTAPRSDRSSAQMLRLDGVPTVLLSSPISDNVGAVTPVGTAIAGRFLGPARIQRLERFINGRIEVTAPSEAHSPWEAIPHASYLTHMAPRIGQRQRVDADRQSIALRFDDSRERPALALRIEQPRTLFLQGLASIRFFLLLVLGVAALAIILMALGVERWVLQRVSRLDREIAGIGTDRGPAQVSVRGSDELASLAGNLNGMIERLKQSESRDAMVLESIGDGFVEVDTEGRILHANPAFGGMLGQPCAGLLGHDIGEWIASPEDREHFTDVLHRLSNHAIEGLLTRFRRQDGSQCICESRLSGIRDGGGQLLGARGILRDVSSQQAYQELLRNQALLDPLTALGNRQAFQQALGELRRRQPQDASDALLFLDLDHFKAVNDTYGHAVGDQLLVAAAERIRCTLRSQDRCFRLGGDEFTVIARDVGREQAGEICRRLVANLAAPYQLAGAGVDCVSASIGVALYPEGAADLEELVRRADAAMYEAKRTRNAYRFDAEPPPDGIAGAYLADLTQA